MNKNPKILNDPHDCAAELLDGLVEAYDGQARKVGRGSIVMSDLPEGKAALLVGGGSGHEPIYHGLVGKNMAHGAACGDIFAAPPPDIVLEATQAVHRGQGVMYLYGNYAGDVMNFDMGAELAAEEGIRVETVKIWDDVASAPPNRKEDRRGIAGLVLIVKIAGAAAATVSSLDELVRITTKARDNTRSVGVAMAAGSIPATGEPTFELAVGKMGVGMGIHGEQGVSVADIATADELAPMLLDLILNDDLPISSGDQTLLFINSLGSTTQMELLILNRAIKPLLRQKGIQVHDTVIGDIVTCQEMAGLSVSLMKLDDELKKYWDMPCQSVGFAKM